VDWFRFYRDQGFFRLSRFVQDGTLFRCLSNEYGFKSQSLFANYSYDATTLALEYFSSSGQLYTNPPIATNALVSGASSWASMFQRAGWAFGNSRDWSDSNAFSSGVGFAIAARPQGQDVGHGFGYEGNIALWAYDSPITDPAAIGVDNQAARLAMFGYVPAVNGRLQAESNTDWDQEARGWISGWEVGANYVYAKTDITKAYPHTIFRQDAVQAYLTLNGSYTNPIPFLTNVTREVLFMRGKYFVISDRLQASSNYTYSWIWHVPNYITNNSTLQNPYTLDGGTSYNHGNGRLQYVTTTAHPSDNGNGNSKPYSFTQVTSIVQHVYGTNKIYHVDATGDWTSVNTTNVYFNPILGDSATNWVRSSDSFTRPHAIWVQNATPTNDWRFITVVYPWKAGTAEPTITPLSDLTVAVANGSDSDVISWGETNALSTLIISAVANGNAGVVVPSVIINGRATISGSARLQ
jgi:hypothetical protein